MPKFDFTPEVNNAAMERFAVGVGFHSLVDGLKRKPRHTDPKMAAVLIGIVDQAPDIVSGLIAAGETVDPSSAFSGPRPTWM